MSPPTPFKFIPKRGVANRYGVKALRTVDRWVKKKAIPPPDRTINGRDYWNESRLDEHDRNQTVDAE